MSHPAGTRRFRVALSFPGEHRGRVEKIAEALAGRLGRDAILYDKWHRGEFARPALGVYLPDLYRHESDLLVFFFCKEYAKKPWCGLEWRAALDLIAHQQYDQLMLLRVDDIDIAEIPGLYSIDGCLDVGDMTDDAVAVEILSRLGETPRKTYRTFISKLPVVNPLLVGREGQIGYLDRAWADPKTNFVQIIAAGGTGKTSLVDKWFRGHLGEATVFGWSFYSQGSSADRQTSSDPFFAEILAWLQIDIAPTASIYAKAEAVARRLREERVLLILDGVEPLQDAAGTLRDMALKALLQELDTENSGLAVCTTRVRLDIPDDGARVLSLDLDNLTAEQGAEYLRSLKVEGTDGELQQASREYWNHALALTLLGTYLVDFCGADVRRRIEIPELMVEDVQHGAHARRVIAAYERMFESKPEAAILRALGYFDRPAEPEALRLVRPKIDYRQYQSALKRLHAARLILARDPAKPLDCHPLVREYFAAEATREGHARLCEHYRDQAPRQPDTIQEMTPLFYAVYHGCRADRHEETLNDVYRKRILRDDDAAHLVKKLGALGTNLSLLANFFATPWTRPTAALSADDQSYVISLAGFDLRAAGRLADALDPTRVAAEASVRMEAWATAAARYNNLSELYIASGNVPEAVAGARQALDFADRSREDFLRVVARAALADALHQSGDLAEAKRLFAEAEGLQGGQSRRPILSSLRGYRYCDLILGQGETAEVLHRASQALPWAIQEGSLLSIGLYHLLLGRAHRPGSADSVDHLDQAIDFLRRAGQLNYLPLGLLARGADHDLDEVFRIAARSGMRLYLADYYLARGNLAEAERLINETGYHRRDLELAELRARVKG
jgi:tetratricopeptide (TPR) repeat protein